MKVFIVLKEYPKRVTKEVDIESWEEGLELSPLKRFIIKEGDLKYIFYSFYSIKNILLIFFQYGIKKKVMLVLYKSREIQ